MKQGTDARKEGWKPRLKGRRSQAAGLLLSAVLLVFVSACGSQQAAQPQSPNPSDSQAQTQPEKKKEPIRIGVLASQTGALEDYGKQTVRGFELGIEYATGGTKEVAGHPIEMIVEDTETKADVAVKKATKLIEDDHVDFLVGSSSSADTLAVVPLAEEYKKVMIVEPAAADSITGANWNKYIFRTQRNSSQDAIAAALAIAKTGTKIATLAQDYAFGRDGVAAFKEAAEKLGAEIILEEYADPKATDVTANLQKIIQAKPEYLYVVWAGANTPWTQIANMKVQEQGIKLTTGTADFAALKTMKSLIGMEGFTLYYYDLPKNKVNDWLVAEHKKRFNGEPPDLFVPGGMTAAISIVEALKKTNGVTDADTLISAMEGMKFVTPKGEMIFRPEDHQALQSMYVVTLENKEGVDYPVPVLITELAPDETAPPIRNNK
ncbi:substrate-binding domain-containing protein [Brevibacillus composti]|uniref:Substrate-binding domain-containing protein n=1 Tax=Brevibacillus composti TaxID=2796470 RepID=A0A7T5JQB4_9BACL|nr:substrate-binding domain-containing protein [Brevibacillus composti]QQE75975.1 substrate-binding domain-containing protein [Brevibacillus composti]QUO43001.1 substrate-binding domain-containing protein [Brevibacillus composti]